MKLLQRGNEYDRPINETNPYNRDHSLDLCSVTGGDQLEDISRQEERGITHHEWANDHDFTLREGKEGTSPANPYDDESFPNAA